MELFYIVIILTTISIFIDFQIYDADILLKEFCQNSSPEPLRTSSNKLKIHFHTDGYGSDSNFQLHYEVESSIPHCGGIYTTASGIIVGAEESSICLYLIEQPTDSQIKLEFQGLDLSEEENCNLNSIEVSISGRILIFVYICEFLAQIFDGKTDEDARTLMVCGGNQIPEPIVSTSNVMLIRFKAKFSNGIVREPFKVKYSRGM